MTGLLTCWALMNLGFAGLQRVLYSKKIRETQLAAPPVFIVGHWRSGTTLLHELMALDDNFAFPTNFDAFVPHHFLISGKLVRPVIRALMPGKRPMDDMSLEVDSPQEDDFALMILGAASHYRRMGFPQNRNEYFRWLDAGNLDEKQNEKVCESIRYFYQALTCKYEKQLILKSPPHTGRIRFLAEWFPDAKFVHISRHPHKIVPSTMRLWKTVDDAHAFHRPKYDEDGLLSYVNQCQGHLYSAYFRDRSELAEDQLVEVRFEELISKPGDTMRNIYQQLGLKGVDEIVSSTQEYFSRKRDHKKNHFNVERLIPRIDEHWQTYMEEFGYSHTSSTNRSPTVA